jgi:hypothetical protein
MGSKILGFREEHSTPNILMSVRSGVGTCFVGFQLLSICMYRRGSTAL